MRWFNVMEVKVTQEKRRIKRILQMMEISSQRIEDIQAYKK